MKTPNLKLSLAALVAAASLGHAARAATLTVTSLADSGPGTLRQQIAAAGNGDTINFKVTGTITLASGQLTVNKNLNIVGPTPNVFDLNWVTVSGNDRSRVFLIGSNATVTMLYLNIAHGHGVEVDGPPDYLYSGGGGIFNFGVLKLSHCTVRDSFGAPHETGEAVGAGIHNIGSLTADHCRILRNNAAGSDVLDVGGRGGGIYSEGLLTLLSSTFYDNIAARGGGLHYKGSAAGLRIVDCTFNRNASGVGGGGGADIDALVPPGVRPLPATVENSTFADNDTFDNGGGLAVRGRVTIKNSTISGNFAHHHGGGLDIMDHDDPANLAILNNVTITDNRIENTLENGSGIKVTGIPGSPPRPDLVRIANSIIAGNKNGYDVFGPIYSLGNNLIQDTTGATITGDQTGNIYNQSADLADLANNGGPTLTHALVMTSPAVDHGRDSTCEPTDQRGVARPVGPHSDIGAYEGWILRAIVVNMHYNPAPYIIVCDPAGPFPSWQGAVLGSRTFDVRTINTTTLRLQTRAAAPVSIGYRDVNGDGIMDLALSFDLNQSLQGQECEAVTQLDLTGLTRLNQPIFGAVQVQVMAR